MERCDTAAARAEEICSLAEGTAQYRRIPELLKLGVVVSLTNASLALMALPVLFSNPESIWLFVLPPVTAALGAPVESDAAGP